MTPWPSGSFRRRGFGDFAEDFSGLGGIGGHDEETQPAGLTAFAAESDLIFAKTIFENLREGGIFAFPDRDSCRGRLPRVHVLSFVFSRLRFRGVAEIRSFAKRERRRVEDAGEKFLRGGNVRGEDAKLVVRTGDSELEDEMIVGRLDVMLNAGFAQRGDGLADGDGVAAFPDEFDTFLAYRRAIGD
jgi:hypothetical protein